MKSFINKITSKKMIFFTALMMAFITSFSSCDEKEYGDKRETGDNEIVVQTSQIINDNYIGNGVQWDPYPQAYKYWGEPISDQDWEKLYKRLDYMKPSFMRVVYGSFDKYASDDADNYDQDKFIEGLLKILEYCQNNQISVLLGDWGFNQVNFNENRIFENRLDNAVKYLDYLVTTKGFSCIKYYTTINEPNLGGSATNGNYDLWKEATLYFHEKMKEVGLDTKVKLAGPDVAVFNNSDVDWISRSANDFGDKLGIYEVHTYPPKGVMFSNEYENLLSQMKEKVPAGYQIVIGEFGYKYDTGEANLDQALAAQNSNTINSDPNIANDSNTLVDEYFHGVDLAGLTMKIVNAGYSGGINWGLDDAMHSGTTTGTDLKVWGFWNILGEELQGKPEKENLRPHFYSFSLLCRYMQKGSKVFKVDVPNKVGLDVIAVEKDGKYMIAINNMHSEDYELKLTIDSVKELAGVKKFIYKEDNRKFDTNGYPAPEEENTTFTSGETLQIAGETLTVLTNFEF